MLSDSNPIISKINYETRRPNKQDNDSVDSQTPYFLSKTKVTTYDPYPEKKKKKPRRTKNNKKLKRTVKLTRKKRSEVYETRLDQNKNNEQIRRKPTKKYIQNK